MESFLKVGKRAERMKAWASGQEQLDEEQFLGDIDGVSKGRFAQRLSSVIGRGENASCPKYIARAIAYVEALANPD
jgi:hypothetical protein